MNELQQLIRHAQNVGVTSANATAAQAFAERVFTLGSHILPSVQLSELRGTPPPRIESLINHPDNEAPFYAAPLLAAAILTLDWRADPQRRAAGRALAISSLHRSTTGPLGAALILSDPGGRGVGTRLSDPPAQHEQSWPLTLSESGRHADAAPTLLHVAGAWLWLSSAGLPTTNPRIIRDWMNRVHDINSATSARIHGWIIENLWQQLSFVHPPEYITQQLDRWSDAIRPPAGTEVQARLKLQSEISPDLINPLPPHLRDREFLKLPKVVQATLQKAGHPLAISEATTQHDDQLTATPPGTVGMQPRPANTDMGPALERAAQAIAATWEGLGVTKAAQIEHAYVTAQSSLPRGGLSQLLVITAPVMFGKSMRLTERPELRPRTPEDITRALIGLAADLEAWIPKGNWHPERVWPVFAQGKGGASLAITKRLLHFGPPTPELLCLAALIGLRQEAYYSAYGANISLPLRLTLSMVATRALERASSHVKATTPGGRQLETYIQPPVAGWVDTHRMMLDMNRSFLQSVSEQELAQLIGTVE